MTNILLITSDQQHHSTFRHPEIQTPNLDRLADSGTVYQRAYCPNPTCTPTRSSMITGKYPSQHGAYSLGTKLPEWEPTVGEAFSRAGYRTALVGKAHFQPLRGSEEFPSLESYPLMQDLDYWQQFEGPFYGFEHVELARNHTDEAHVGQHYALWMEEKGLTNWRDHFQKPTGTQDAQRHKWSLPEEFHYNTWIAERSKALLSEYQQKGESFFLWASFFDPHPSYLVPEPWDTMYDPAHVTVPQVTPGEHDHNPPHFQMTQTEKPDFSAWKEAGGNAMHGFQSHLQDRDSLARDIAVYYGMISCMDKYIGQIVDQLEALGLRDDTLIVYTSDHGHFFGQHGLIAKGPFHYEDVVRVPFIVSWPEHVPVNAESEAMQTLVDLPQTLLSVCGIDSVPGMTGVDQSSVWLGERNAARDHVIVEDHHQPTTIHVKTYISQRYKFTAYYQHDYGEIFDLQNDPAETHNLWADESLRASLLEELLRAEIAKEEPPTPETTQRANKNPAMYTKTYSDGQYMLTLNSKSKDCQFIDLRTGDNHWDNPAYYKDRTRLLWALLFERMGAEPLWMPRIWGA
ncbi:MAG: sulfatase-like hydrolase/transferase [Anaerolineae bacterium]|nr:sulfatase-like hydrolase/transferase [Anaerolineae bacterium]